MRVRLRYRLRAGNGTRTRDPNLGKVVLYQLSYSRNVGEFYRESVIATSSAASSQLPAASNYVEGRA